MNKVIAKIRLYNVFTSTMCLSKSPPESLRNSDTTHYHRIGFNRSLKQGFAWYRDFILFDMLSDYRSYWVKVAVSENLELDPVIANLWHKNTGDISVIILPFQVVEGERIYVLADIYDESDFLSFTLPVGHYQLLFQNRYFTRDEIESDPIFNCEDLDYDDPDDAYEFCLLTFITTKTAIEPKILAYKSHFRSTKSLTPLILFDRKISETTDD